MSPLKSRKYSTQPSFVLEDFSQEVTIAQIELLLNYANRHYKRRFITRKAISHDLFQNLEEILGEYFGNEQSLNQGIPTVQYLAGRQHVSPSYLSDMLRSLTGQNAQQHIHQKLIEKAKEQLSATSLSVSEIAYSPLIRRIKGNIVKRYMLNQAIAVLTERGELKNE